MPEGPEVRVIADTIAQAVGKMTIDVWHTQNKKYKWKRDGIPGWDKLCAGSKCWTFDKVEVKGKLIRVDISQKDVLDRELSMLSTLGLEGFWSWECRAKSHAKHKRITFEFLNGSKLSYYDSRNFGTLRIMEPEEADKKMNKIGFDLLQGTMPQIDWANLKTNKKIAKKPIGEVLMRQTEFSGIGNIYKAETLYSLGINPTTLVEDCDAWDDVQEVAHKIMADSYAVKGSSVKSYSGGSFQRTLQIYKKEQCPKGHTVSSVKQNNRTTWYCPTCQK